MASEVQICNLALSHLGIGRRIASLTEKTQEARACSLHFETARDATLRDFPWPFANKIATLQLIEEDPNSEWSYSYRYPTDCLNLLRVLSGERVDTPDTRVEFKLGHDDSGQLIYSDKEDAEAEYTLRVSNPARFPPDFVIALSLRLAAYISTELTGGDPFKLGARASGLYDIEVGRSQATALNEQKTGRPPESEFVTARE